MVPEIFQTIVCKLLTSQDIEMHHYYRKGPSRLRDTLDCNRYRRISYRLLGRRADSVPWFVSCLLLRSCL